MSRQPINPYGNRVINATKRTASLVVKLAPRSNGEQTTIILTKKKGHLQLKTWNAIPRQPFQHREHNSHTILFPVDRSTLLTIQETTGLTQAHSRVHQAVSGEILLSGTRTLA